MARASLRIEWTAEAQQDLKKIRRFIAQDAPRRATAFTNRIKTTVSNLRHFPELGAVVKDLCDPGVRQILVGSYRILYRLRKPLIRILPVVHGARLLKPEDLPQ
jgi:addiction module RelE/StbE family toxin